VAIAFYSVISYSISSQVTTLKKIVYNLYPYQSKVYPGKLFWKVVKIPKIQSPYPYLKYLKLNSFILVTLSPQKKAGSRLRFRFHWLYLKSHDKRLISVSQSYYIYRQACLNGSVPKTFKKD
jgi:hypothetical protein